MRAPTVALALMLIAGTAFAQNAPRSNQGQSAGGTGSTQGLGYGGGAGGTNGYGYSDKGTGLHYGGGYIRNDGSTAPPQGGNGTQTGTSGTRSTFDPATGLGVLRNPRY